MTAVFKIKSDAETLAAGAAAMHSGEVVGAYSSALISSHGDIVSGALVGAFSSALVETADFNMAVGAGLHLASSALDI